jgi:hypothetical protein
MLRTITMSNIEHFLLRKVAIFGLDESISPFCEHRGVAGHGPVLVDDLIEFRSIDVVDGIAGQGRELEFERKAVINIRQSGRVPLQCIALAGKQQGDGDICIVLAKLHGCAAVVEHSILMLPETVHSLVCIGREAVGDFEGFLAIHFGGS